MSSLIEKSKDLVDTGNGLLCRIYCIKAQMNSDERPQVLNSGEHQKLRSKLEKNPYIETAEMMKVTYFTLMIRSASQTVMHERITDVKDARPLLFSTMTLHSTRLRTLRHLYQVLVKQ